jgi:large subunit ribosomal protein L2
MGIKILKKNNAGRRNISVDDFSDITKTTPEKSLILIKKRSGGRNCTGKITVRHRSGGAKRYIRIVDFKRDKFDIPGTVAAIEYDPNRNARLALIVYKDGAKRYMIAPVSLKVGDPVISSKNKVDIKPGNATKIENIPIGTLIFSIELVPGAGAKVARAAGTQVKLMAVEGLFAQIKMPSTEIRLVPKECMATIGQSGNPDIMHMTIGKAGRKRHMGIKPTVLGKSMNPVDHPHGGGEGHCPIGLKHPRTPWGKPALGVKTRKTKYSDKFILSRRKSRRKSK